LRKVANRQTDRQTNDDDYITSLAEVIKLQFTYTKLYKVGLWYSACWDCRLSQQLGGCQRIHASLSESVLESGECQPIVSYRIPQAGVQPTLDPYAEAFIAGALR